MGNERNPFHVTQSTHTQVFFRYFVHVTLLTALGLFVSVNIENFQYLHSLFINMPTSSIKETSMQAPKYNPLMLCGGAGKDGEAKDRNSI